MQTTQSMASVWREIFTGNWTYPFFRFHNFTMWKIMKRKLGIPVTAGRTTSNITRKTTISFTRTGRWKLTVAVSSGLSDLWDPCKNSQVVYMNFLICCVFQGEMNNEMTVVPRKKPAGNSAAQHPPAHPGKSKAAKMRAVARGENTASSGKSEQEVMLKIFRVQSTHVRACNYRPSSFV